MSFFSSIGKALGTVTSIADKVTSFLKAPVASITQPLDGAVNGLLGKLPFGIGSFVAPYADKFLNSAVGWLASGPLGGFMSTLQSFSGDASKIDSVLDTVNSAVNGGVASLPAPALANAQDATAYAQSQGLATT